MASGGRRFVDPLPPAPTSAAGRRRQRPRRRRDGLRDRRRGHRLDPVHRRPRADHGDRRSGAVDPRAGPVAGDRQPARLRHRRDRHQRLRPRRRRARHRAHRRARPGHRAVRRPGPARRPRDRLHDRATAARSSPAASSRTAAPTRRRTRVLVRLAPDAVESGARRGRPGWGDGRLRGPRACPRSTTTPVCRDRRPSTARRRSASTPTSSSEPSPGGRARRRPGRRRGAPSRRRRGGCTCRRRATSSSWGPSSTRRPSCEHEHPVGPGGRRQAVGDGDRRATLGEVGEGPRDADLGQGVDRRRRLVEHEHVGVGDTGPQQGDELALARRQLVAALADGGQQTRRAARRPSRRRRAARRRPPCRRSTCPAGRSRCWRRSCR